MRLNSDTLKRFCFVHQTVYSKKMLIIKTIVLQKKLIRQMLCPIQNKELFTMRWSCLRNVCEGSVSQYNRC